MSRKGAGTRNSPIDIDDSEEEVLNIVEVADDSQGSTPPVRTPNEHALLDSSLSHYQVSTLFKRLQEDSPPPTTKKRKRSESLMTQATYAMSDIAGPSSLPQQLPLETRLSNVKPESKKARKRRRRLERQEAEHRMRMQQRGWPTPGSQSYPAFPPSIQSRPQTYPSSSHFSDPALVATSMVPLSTDYIGDPYTPYMEDMQKFMTPPEQLSGSSWVSSMVMAASTPELNPVEPESQQYVASPTERLPVLKPAVYALPPPMPEHVKPSTLPLPPKAPEVHAHTPKPQQHIIGMKPDPDPKSKHGVFTFPKNSNTSTYIPNPAKTLVMEQLPKQYRNADFASTWGKKASGSQPIHVSIDAVQHKALVEFATAELARKAWGSPKLGSQYAGLKPHQLRGKAREDLIKVWWYRVDGVGAGAGVGEIEEGEIEGEEVEKEPVEVQPKKETKKERKARLAREREEKRRKLESAQKELALKAVLQGATVQTSNSSTQASMASQPDPAVAAQLAKPLIPATIPANGALHSHPASYSLPPALNRGHQYTAPSSLPPPPSHLPRNPMAPTLKTLRMPSGTSLGSSLPGGLNTVHDDQASIASSHGEGSKSPEVRRSTVVESAPLDDYQDMDLDGDDMDLDSPDSPVAPTIPTSLPAKPASTIEIVAPTPKMPVPPAPAPAAPTSTRIRNIPPSGMQSLPYLANQRPSVPTPRPQAITLSSLHLSSSTTPTPTLCPPTEPKAVRDAPTAPSHLKRSLLARQKELEERIAKSKMELQLASKTAQNPKPSAPAVAASSTAVLPSQGPSFKASSPSSEEIDKQAMENRLRQLVLKSQKSQKRATVLEPPHETPPPSSSASSQTTASSTSDSPAKMSTNTADSTTVSVAAHAFSLEDLAVSFITQTIQTVQSQPAHSAPPTSIEPVETNTRSSLKLELAAKQKRLEQHIAESKVLMAKLTQARTKQEKDAILAAMREHSRLMEEEERVSRTATETPSASGNATTQDPSARLPAKEPITLKIRWPESQVDAGVFIVSDDEESDTADDG